MLNLSQAISIENKTIPSKQMFGRYLYLVHQLEQKYWLKINIEKQTDQADFNYEYKVYQLLRQMNCKIILDYQIMSINSSYKCYFQFNEYPVDALVLPDKMSYFDSLPPKDIITLKQEILKLLNVLFEFHQLGLVHGDLKPTHWLKEENHIYLIDFEQATSIWLEKKQQALAATPHYMAPELFLGHQRTPASDIYALGLILYEWLSHKVISTMNYQQWYHFHQQGIDIDLTGDYAIFKPILEMMLAYHRVDSLIEVIEKLEMINI